LLRSRGSPVWEVPGRRRCMRPWRSGVGCRPKHGKRECLHNHPSGDPTPSAEDRVVTEQLVAAGRLLDIPVHDHIIVGRGRYVSFAEAGLL